MNSKNAQSFSGDFPKHAEISRASTTINNKICQWIFSLRSQLALGKRKCEIYFIVSVVLAQQILAGLGKVAERPKGNHSFYEFMMYRNVQ